jgi:hypothetical protein
MCAGATAAAVAILAGPGCDPFHREAVRARTDVMGATDSDADLPEESSMRGSHKPGLKPGSWSSEAQEIESHFNVNR